ncbi:hypothetical protein [Cupriavidus neocaledonicus]|uniref:Uncharacterized protein n=1 Tax=Cupriavidus neocaledonicus TaxID=1040979 RepID=A0A375H9I9_9BURK|nr:hypothetical protein [Cupriavidus neocaledonicus]SOZ35572.1 conserved hypothetical protein [Cupriavidus neocaledonicus]SPD47556.1 conserved protein of unknown function [Cupriavidus neocaledonicus]
MDFELFRQTCQQFLRTSSQFLGLAAAGRALPMPTLPTLPASQPQGRQPA